jgi:hypothetical protein
LLDVFRLIIGGLFGVLLYVFLAFLFKMTAFTELKNLIKKP